MKTFMKWCFFSLHIFSVVWTQIYKYFIYIFGWMLLVWGGVVFEDWFHNGAAIFNSHLQSENVNHSTIHVHNRHLQNNLHFTNVYRSKFLKEFIMENYISFYDRQANVERKARSFCIGCKVECGSLFFLKKCF